MYKNSNIISFFKLDHIRSESLIQKVTVLKWNSKIESRNLLRVPVKKKKKKNETRELWMHTHTDIVACLSSILKFRHLRQCLCVSVRRSSLLSCESMRFPYHHILFYETSKLIVKCIQSVGGNKFSETKIWISKEKCFELYVIQCITNIKYIYITSSNIAHKTNKFYSEYLGFSSTITKTL